MKIDLCAFGRMSKREKKHFVHKLSEWERVQLLQAVAAANARKAYTPVEDRHIFSECQTRPLRKRPRVHFGTAGAGGYLSSKLLLTNKSKRL